VLLDTRRTRAIRTLAGGDYGFEDSRVDRGGTGSLAPALTREMQKAGQRDHDPDRPAELPHHFVLKAIQFAIESVIQGLDLRIDSVAKRFQLRIDSVAKRFQLRIESVAKHFQLRIDTPTQGVELCVESIIHGPELRIEFRVEGSDCDFQRGEFLIEFRLEAQERLVELLPHITSLDINLVVQIPDLL
jgi:hypothetical protein